MVNKADIYKVGGILIRDKKLLVGRNHRKDVFIAPGGKVGKGENPVHALVRELAEELGISVRSEMLKEFGTFYAKAAGNEEMTIRMDVFLVDAWDGEPQPTSEVEEIAWIPSYIPEGVKVGSIFEHEVIPRLKDRNLID